MELKPPCFEVKNLQVAIHRSGTQIVHATGFDVQPGSRVAVIGPNGCGKSTLLKALAGISRFQGLAINGVIQYQAESLTPLPANIWAKKVAYLSQGQGLGFPLTCLEVVTLGRIQSQGGDQSRRALEQMKFFNCDALADQLYDSVSGGERQRVNLARAVFQGAPVLLLDEALSQMDLDFQILIGDRLRDWIQQDPNQRAFFLVAHDINFALRNCDYALVFFEGQQFRFGPCQEVIDQSCLDRIFSKSQARLRVSNSGLIQVDF